MRLELVNIILNYATSNIIKEIYLTVFEKYEHFLEIMIENGFSEYTSKRTLKTDGNASLEID